MDSRTDKEPAKKKAEGSIEDVDLGTPDPAASGGDAGAPMERGAGQVSRPDKPLPRPGEPRPRGGAAGGYQPKDDDQAGGIANRPLDEEAQNQRDLPPRGRTKSEEGGE